MSNEREELPVDGMSTASTDTQVQESRRKLMAKLAAGAFAVPAVLASISRESAASSLP